MINMNYDHINTKNSFIVVKQVRQVRVCMIWIYMRQSLGEEQSKVYFKGQKDNSNC